MNVTGTHEENSANLKEGPHELCISLGSNILPEQHIPKAVNLLRQFTQVETLSQCWETAAVGSDGPNFINMAVRLLTPLDATAVKTQIIESIESALGRVRTQDKNAPRTIDLDIILFDGIVLDQNLWKRVHLALPVSELFPDLKHPGSGQSLNQVAHNLLEDVPVRLRPEILC